MFVVRGWKISALNCVSCVLLTIILTKDNVGSANLLFFSGAAKEGVVGFFSGLGRGAVSMLTKPTLAVVDLTRYTMEGVRRSALQYK